MKEMMSTIIETNMQQTFSKNVCFRIENLKLKKN